MADTFSRRVIVGGLPRSGTTLLRFILDRSGALIAGPETSFFLEPLHRQQARVERVAGRVAKKLDLDVASVARRITGGTSAFNAFDGIMADYADAVGRQPTGWAEKTPLNCFSYGWLAAEDPKALFISVVRDGLDVVTSVVDRPDTADRYWCSVQRYADSMAAVLGFTSTRHHVLRYEDLVSNPAKVASDLFAWLGVPYSPEVVSDFAEPSATRDLSKVTQPKLAEPIRDSWVGRWQDNRHAARIEEFFAHPTAGQWRRRIGYPEVNRAASSG